ncbi:TRAP transporter substrate-binding protein [Petrocella sp. FN5]|uniref:TRAP transporter substrate-binding protein n=1 Tax=Petrocella sp. FN5 TaxID=3032002 RepID=UPI0023D9A1B6|nr:TRAP transporter substrate-binding protein [Petrocella sp. FN5]MDF1617061.1 TRAP transporter substrate-binding protein [Petrocella sp. FN5]
MKMKNFIVMLVVVSLLVSLFVGCSSDKATTEPSESVSTETEVETDEAMDDTVYSFKFGHAADENNTWHKGAMKFAEEVEAQSNGRIKIEVYANEQLGNEIDNVTAIQAGTADMVLSGESLQNWANLVGVMSTPYLIKDSEHMNAVINGEPGKILEEAILNQAGLKVLTYFERGPRMLTSNKPINDINDLQGLNLRLPNVPLFIEVWNAWGARPVPMAFSEVFTSLQQNVIEAQDNPLALMYSGGFYEVQKYINKTEHVRGWIYMLIGVDQWNELPEDLQAVMMDAAQVAHDYEYQLFTEGEEATLNILLEEKGLEFIETDTTEMVRVAEEYYEENLSPDLFELYTLIKNTK